MGELNNIDDSFNPYVGPRTFEEADRTYFFGREREARDLLSFVISEQLVLFYAQSGAGKSSLINARFVPSLRDEGFEVLPIGRVGGSLPDNIDDVRNIFVLNLLLSLEQDRADPSALTHTTLAEYLDKIKNPKIHMTAAEPARVLIIDQFEEIVTTHLGRWQERQSFFGQLRRAMDNDPLLWVVLTIREDHIAAIEPYAHLFPDKLRARFHMRRMRVESALAAIKQPASISGKPFESGVAKSLVDNLRQIRVRDQNIPAPDEPVQREAILGEYVEPVQLQVVCYQLWENLKRRPVNKITRKDLDELGDVDTALGHFYESAIRVAATESEEPEAKLRRWFENKLITEAGMRGTVSQGVEVTAELDNHAVQILANQYLLRADRRAGSIWYELIHDRFVDPILKANHAWRLQQSLVYQAAEEWERSGRKREKLYQGEQLKEALANVDLASQESLLQEFLKASDAAQSQRELREMEHRVAVERRTSQRLRRLTFALIGASFLAVGLAVLAFRQGATARENEAEALRNADLAVMERQTAVAGSTEVAKAYEIAEASLATQAASLELQLSASSLTSTASTPNAEALATAAAIETQLIEIRATQTAVACTSVALQRGMNINPDAPFSNPLDSGELLGLDWVRWNFKLAARSNIAERGDINAAFQQYDPLVEGYVDQGVGSIIILNQETVWGNAPWSNSDEWDTYADSLADIANQIASHYASYGQRIVFEVWNEEDVQLSPSSIYVPPDKYAIILQRTAEAIRDAAPEAQILFGSLGDTGEQGVEYVQLVRGALGGPLPVDAIGLQPYGRWATRAPFDWGSYFGTLEGAFDLFAAAVPGIPLWVTEIGISDDVPLSATEIGIADGNEISPRHYQEIANYMQDVYRYIGDHYVNQVRAVIWFAWSDWMLNAGIVDINGQPKEFIYEAFEDVRSGKVFCLTGDTQIAIVDVMPTAVETTIPPGSMIEPLSQRDPRWSNLRLGQAGSTRTIGDWGPLLVSMTMLANSFGKDITPSDLNASFIRQGGYLDTNLLKWNALSNVYSDIIYMGKISDQTDILSRIDASLASGIPVISQVDFTPDTPYDVGDEHWILIVDKDGDDYRIFDPWLYPAQERSLSDQYGRPSELDEPVVLSAIFYRSISQ